MRQYDIDFPKMFKTGLRPEKAFKGEGIALTYASNVYPENDILRGATPWTESFPTITEDCQFFSCVTGFYILTPTKLYSWNGVTLTPLLSGLTVGGRWSVADFNALVAFTNGVVTIVRKPNAEVWAVDIGNTVTKKQFSTFCHFRGRLIGANANILEWSRIGSIEFLPITTDKESLLKLTENEAGYRMMDWPGTIYNILPLGQSVVVYGSNGITLIEPVTVHISELQGRQSINTFKFTNIDPVGIPSAAAAIAATEDSHYFVRNDMLLYKLTLKGKQKIGFAEFIDNPKLSFSDAEGNELLVVSCTDASVLFTEAGAGGSSFTGAVGFDSRFGFVCHSSKPIDMTTCEFWSDTIQLGRSGEKTIEQVILDAINLDTDQTQVSIGVKTSSKDAWVFTPWYTFNDSLEAHPGVTGNLFMVKVKVAQQFVPNFRNIVLGIQYTDRRFTQGAVGAKSDTQTSS